MATSEVQIANSALTKIGERKIVSFDDDSKAARACAAQYPIARDALLRRYRWNFAKERVQLAPENGAPAFGFEKKFLQPADCLHVIGIYDEGEPQNNYTSSRIPWKVEGRYILCDENPLPIFYIKKVTDPTQFDPLFSEALAWSLALDLAYDLTSGPDYIVRAQDKLTEVTQAAKKANAFEGTPETFIAGEWVDAHAGYTGSQFRPGPIWS